MTILITLLAPYFPYGLPANRQQARDMVRKAIEHLLG